MTDLLKNLKLDEYYMFLVYLGSILFILSMFYPTQWIANKQLALLSSGILCIGLGEWKNHKWVSWIKPANVYTGGAALMKQKIRQSDLVGNFLILIGILLFLTGILDLLGLSDNIIELIFNQRFL